MIPADLLKHAGGYIGGQWVCESAGGTFDVVNPATGEVLASLPNMGEVETNAAIEACERALRAAPAPSDRRNWLMAIHDRMLERKHDLGRLITLEHGKPLKEGMAEVEYTAGFFRFFAEQIDRLGAEPLPGRMRNCRWTIHHRPAGVVGLITPWNFPMAMIGKKVAPALAAGCAAVVKPAREAPLSTLALCSLAEEVGVPAGRFNVVVGQAGPIGAALCRHPAVRLISFTGSTEVGRLLIANTAPHIKKLAMELGGNAPFLVFADADLEAAVAALMANKFRAGGQTCVCTNRVYVHRSIARPFTDAVVARVRALRIGNGLDADTDIGPLINRDAFDKVAAHVRDALARGATRLVGGDPPRPSADWGAFYPPTVLTGITPDMLVCREETFGPVVAIGEFDDEDRVVEDANGTCYGLAAYVFTRDAARAERILPRLHFGHVGLNTGTGPTPEAPFGGMKQSGFGREGGLEGLLEFCDTQVVATP